MMKLCFKVKLQPLIKLIRVRQIILGFVLEYNTFYHI